MAHGTAVGAAMVMGPATRLRATAMAPATATRLIAVTAIRLTAMGPVTAIRLTAMAMAGALSAALSTAPLGVAVGKEPDNASRRVSAEERLLGRSKLGAAAHYEDRFHT